MIGTGVVVVFCWEDKLDTGIEVVLLDEAALAVTGSTSVTFWDVCIVTELEGIDIDNGSNSMGTDVFAFKTVGAPSTYTSLDDIVMLLSAIILYLPMGLDSIKDLIVLVVVFTTYITILKSLQE